MTELPPYIRTLLCAIGLLCAYTSPASNANTIETTGAPAELVDAGDYYLGLNGQPIRFLRKRDLYLDLDSVKQARQQANNRLSGIAEHLREALPAGFARVENHRWKGLQFLRDQRPAAARLAAAENFVPDDNARAPVFSSANGQGEYLILPDIIVSYSGKAEAEQYQATLLATFDMRVKNQLMFSDTEFVLAFNEAGADYRRVFETTRAIMALPYIDWAEPNMLVRLKKTAAPDPNDLLFREQWALHNWGKDGELCIADPPPGVAADIDADDAWDYMDIVSPSYTPVIAIIDDGVQLNHPDIPLWSNPNPSDPNFGGGSNVCIGDEHGCNFGDYYIYGGGTGRTYNRSGPDILAPDGGTLVPPEPQTVNDVHGTQVAGIAAATRNNSIGIAGSAYNAEIISVRLDFSTAMDCVSLVDAFSYAANYADVISNSWQLDIPETAACQSALDSKISSIAANDIPILFAAGNSGAGWQKVTVELPDPGTLQLTLHKDFDFGVNSGEDAVWIDDVKLPGEAVEPIGAGRPAYWYISNPGTNDAGTGSEVYSGCTATLSTDVSVDSSGGNHVRGGTGYAMKLDTAGDTCKYLQISNVAAGTLEFWVWISVETWDPDGAFTGDLFRVYLNGSPVGQDQIQRSNVDRGLNAEIDIYHNQLPYPAYHTEVITVGASNDGSSAQMEERAYFSQYADGSYNYDDPDSQDPNHAGILDILAPGTSIRSTKNGGKYGYLSGTSASTPLVAGVIANMLAVDSGLTLAEIKTILRNSADKIGPDAGEFAYSSGFNKYYGYGRVNAYNAARLANSDTPLTATETCEDPNPGAEDDLLLLIIPAIISATKQ